MSLSSAALPVSTRDHLSHTVPWPHCPLEGNKQCHMVSGATAILPHLLPIPPSSAHCAWLKLGNLPSQRCPLLCFDPSPLIKPAPGPRDKGMWSLQNSDWLNQAWTFVSISPVKNQSLELLVMMISFCWVCTLGNLSPELRGVIWTWDCRLPNREGSTEQTEPHRP